MTILVIGGTGMIGRHVTRAVAETASQDVRVMIHQGDVDGRQFVDSVDDATPVTADLDHPEQLAPVFEDVERVFLLTPYTDAQAERERAAIDAAEAAGVQHVVKLAGRTEYATALAWPHEQVIDHLEAASMDHTVLHCDNLMDNYRAELQALQHGVMARPPGDTPAAPVAAIDVASVAAALLTEPDPILGAITLTGPQTLTWQDQARTLAGRAAPEDLQVSWTPPTEWRNTMIEHGMSHAYATGLIALYNAITANGPTEPTDAVERVTDQEPTSFVEFVSTHL